LALLAEGCTGRNVDTAVARTDETSEDVADAGTSDLPQPDAEPGSETTTAIPAMHVVPTRVEFGTVWPGEVTTATVNVLNAGTGILEIEGFEATGSGSFALAAWGTEVEISAQTAQGIPLPETVTVVPGGNTFFKVHFGPTDLSPAFGKVVLLSNDPDWPVGHEVELVGNQTVPCMAVNPTVLDFGVAKVGTEVVKSVEVVSCGKKPLLISGVRFMEGASPAFSIKASEDSSIPSPDNPVELITGQSWEVLIVYAPDAPSPQFGDGTFMPDEGILVTENDAFESEKETLVKGIGLDGDYPVAVITSSEPDEVAPQCTVHLFGEESYSANGKIVEWQWSAKTPMGDTSQFVPSATFPNPTFETNVAGVYQFELTVVDELGFESPLPDIREMLVLPCCFGFTVELTWQTPGDSDPDDSGPGAMADLDLHLLHPDAMGEDVDGDGVPDGWFDQLFDCFWFNHNPKSWGPGFCGLDGGPGLVEGGYGTQGYEAISYCMPPSHQFRIGVHYWDDHSFGASVATVRVYACDSLVWQATDIELQPLDLWAVGTIDWSMGKVVPTTTDSGSPLTGSNVLPSWAEM